jgi:hypothetical protein
VHDADSSDVLPRVDLDLIKIRFSQRSKDTLDPVGAAVIDAGVVRQGRVFQSLA